MNNNGTNLQSNSMKSEDFKTMLFFHYLRVKTAGFDTSKPLSNAKVRL